MAHSQTNEKTTSLVSTVIGTAIVCIANQPLQSGIQRPPNSFGFVGSFDGNMFSQNSQRLVLPLELSILLGARHAGCHVPPSRQNLVDECEGPASSNAQIKVIVAGDPKG